MRHGRSGRYQPVDIHEAYDRRGLLRDLTFGIDENVNIRQG
jgi:hypothetical protein